MSEKVDTDKEKYRFIIYQGYIHKIPLNNKNTKDQSEYFTEKLTNKITLNNCESKE